MAVSEPEYGPFSEFESKFSQSDTPSFFCFWHTHQTARKKRSEFPLRRIHSLGMYKSDGLPHLLTNSTETLFLALSAILLRKGGNQGTLLGKVIGKLAYCVTQMLLNLTESLRLFLSVKDCLEKCLALFKIHTAKT